MPAISTTRFSWISPQRPRTCGPAQGLDQIGRLGLKLLLGFHQRLDLLGQAAVGPGPGLFHLVDLRVHLLQRFFDRLDEFLDRLLAFFQVALGRFLELLQRGLRQFEERLVVALQGLGGQGLEGVGQLSCWASLSTANFSSACFRSWSSVVTSCTSLACSFDSAACCSAVFS